MHFWRRSDWLVRQSMSSPSNILILIFARPCEEKKERRKKSKYFDFDFDFDGTVRSSLKASRNKNKIGFLGNNKAGMTDGRLGAPPLRGVRGGGFVVKCGYNDVSKMHC